MRFVQQLVSNGCHVTPGFRADFTELATSCGVSPSLDYTPLNLRILEELFIFCTSLKGRVILEQLWDRTNVAEPAYEAFAAVRTEELIA